MVGLLTGAAASYTLAVTLLVALTVTPFSLVAVALTSIVNPSSPSLTAYVVPPPIALINPSFELYQAKVTGLSVCPERSEARRVGQSCGVPLVGGLCGLADGRLADGRRRVIHAGRDVAGRADRDTVLVGRGRLDLDREPLVALLDGVRRAAADRVDKPVLRAVPSEGNWVVGLPREIGSAARRAVLWRPAGRRPVRSR